MTSLEAALRQIHADLTQAGVSFALVGGLGVSARTEPQDLVDLRALLRVASSGELARARGALALIAARGYHRGRDLSSEMNTLLPLVP